MVEGGEVLVVVGVEEEGCSQTHCHWVWGERVEVGENDRKRDGKSEERERERQ